MARFFRGAGVGTYWHGNNARLQGFIPHAPGAARTLGTYMSHIARGTTQSPCVSLTKSYGVAEEYAVNASRQRPTQSQPAFVYELDLADPLPSGCVLLDPVAAISGAAHPLASPSYHHDGGMSFLLGIIDPLRMANHLTSHIRAPPGSQPTPRAANLTMELEAMVRALRDAEVLVIGTVPAVNVIARYDVF